ncbi:hypothetical protein [Algoriphagus sp. NG3]|uniref:hypothetical protein n=1 Tax=Algoriphagus sp. NG3 TaxID=3097546 RepID=UPI002A83EB58|nr:hypothetical protein [Algoriphagus sp. NG3]WPR76209.1 hypothetical protein SLW71_02470 [Algoriphagus sp. NG3]
MPVAISSLLYLTEDLRELTEMALTQVVSESYDASTTLLVEKGINIKLNYKF